MSQSDPRFATKEMLCGEGGLFYVFNFPTFRQLFLIFSARGKALRDHCNYSVLFEADADVKQKTSKCFLICEVSLFGLVLKLN